MRKSNSSNRARYLSLRRKHSTRASDVRARCRAGWSRSVPCEIPLRQRDGRLPRCTAVLRRASCGLKTRSLLAYMRKSNWANRARSLSLRTKRSTRGSNVSASIAQVGVGLYPKKPTAPAGRPLLSVQGRAPTCELRPPNEKLTCVRAQVKQRKPHALTRPQEEAQHARFRRARASPR